MAENYIPKIGITLTEIAFRSAMFIALSTISIISVQAKPLSTVENIELGHYLGIWYEVVRKPLYFQNKCERDVSAIYTLNENGNVLVDNRCYGKEGQLYQSIGEAFIQNSPHNTKFRVSFLPEFVRWLPVGRGDYWILKIDEDYQTVLVGEPQYKYMWILSRQPNPDPVVVNEYLNYAKSIGYDLSNIIHTKQTEK